MMLALLAASVVGNGIGVGAFLRYLAHRDQREERQLANLLDRIQAPAVAVARSSTEHIDPLPKSYVGFDNDEEAYEAAQRRSPTRES